MFARFRVLSVIFALVVSLFLSSLLLNQTAIGRRVIDLKHMLSGQSFIRRMAESEVLRNRVLKMRVKFSPAASHFHPALCDTKVSNRFLARVSSMFVSGTDTISAIRLTKISTSTTSVLPIAIRSPPPVNRPILVSLANVGRLILLVCARLATPLERTNLQ